MRCGFIAKLNYRFWSKFHCLSFWIAYLVYEESDVDLLQRRNFVSSFTFATLLVLLPILIGGNQRLYLYCLIVISYLEIVFSESQSQLLPTQIIL